MKSTDDSETRYTAVLVINYCRSHPEKKSQNKNKQIWLTTDGWHSRSVTLLFSHRGATDGWWVRTGRGKYWTVTRSHSVFLYRRGLYALTIYPLYSPAFFLVHLRAAFPVLIYFMTMKAALGPIRERRCGRRNRCGGKIAAKQHEAPEWGRTASSHTDGGSSRRHEAWTEGEMTVLDVHWKML